jgi:hypothetical protein
MDISFLISTKLDESYNVMSSLDIQDVLSTKSIGTKWNSDTQDDDFPVRNIASIKSPEFPGTDRFLAVLTGLCKAIVYCLGQDPAGFS